MNLSPCPTGITGTFKGPGGYIVEDTDVEKFDAN